MITIDPGVLLILLGWGGTIIAALTYVSKARADTQKVSEESKGEVAKTEAASDGRLTEAILTLAQSLNASSQQAGVERQQTLMAIEKSGGRVEGMMVAIVDNTKTIRDSTTAIKDMGTQLDDFGGRLQHLPQIKSDVLEIKGITDGLPTELETINTQFGPVVEELRGIGTRISQTNDRLTELFTEFRGAERRVLAILEPYAIAQAERLRSQTLTATTTVEETQTATVTEETPTP